MAAVALGFLTACEDVPAPYYVLAPQSSEEILENLEGEGTKENPYTAADAVKIIKAGAYTSQNVYIKGIISQVGVEGKDGEITDLPGNNYGNATYFISPDGSATDQIEIYRGSGLGGEKISRADYIKVGDEVIVYGILTLYGSTPEVTQGSKIYYLNGQIKEVEEQKSNVEPAGSGTKEDPYNVAGAQKLIDQVGNSESEFIYVKGIISQIDEINKPDSNGRTYGNATYFISDDGTTVGQLEVYRGFGLGGDKLEEGDLKVGDEVIVYGKVINYNNKTHEFTSGSKLYSLNGQTKDVEEKMGEAKGSGTLEDPYNPAGAAQAVKDLTWTSNTEYQTTDVVYVKGKISRIDSGGTYNESGTYGNAKFYISEDGSESGEFYCYRVMYLGNKKYEAGQTDIKVGDEVIICGTLMNYRGNTPETVSNKAYLYSLNGKVDGGDTPNPPMQLEGSGTSDDPYTIYDVFQLYNAGGTKDKVFVKAYIVGYVTGQSFESGAVFGADQNASNTNILVGTTSDCTDLNNCVPVALPSETQAPGIRAGVSLASNPNNLGQEVLLYGTIEKYFNVAGVKNVTYAVITEVTGSSNSYGTNPEAQTKRR